MYNSATTSPIMVNFRNLISIKARVLNMAAGEISYDIQLELENQIASLKKVP